MKKVIGNIAGDDFIYTDENKALLNKMFHYFNGNKEECEQLGITLNKGLAIFGEYGCGKTLMFRLMHTFLSMGNKSRLNSFKMVSIEDIINVASDDKFLDSVYCYNTTLNVHGVLVRNPVHLLVNEFGSKYNVKLYGTDVNELLEMFWMKRYEIYTDHHKLTHLTSNIDIKGLVDNNSPKIVDRFKEMMQFEMLKGKSFRK